MLTTPDYSLIERKFYQYSRSFNQFEKINLSQIKLDVNSFLTNNLNDEKQPLKYFKILEYLVQPRQNTHYTFDERIAFLILAIDPELEQFKAFLTIKPKNNEHSKKILASTIRSKIGLFSEKLLTFEKAFFEQFYEELLNNINFRCIDTLLKKVDDCENFAILTDQDFIKLNQIKLLFPQNVTLNTCAFNILYQNNILQLNTTAEQLALLIIVAEEKLNALKIFEEECTAKGIRRRMIEQFGFYNFNLIRAEKMYKTRFFPNLNLTEWSKLEKK